MKFKQTFIGLWALLILTNQSVVMHAQVTIGSQEQSAPGALLDLKQEVKADGSANSRKGLGLPRVKLLSEKLASGESNLATTVEGSSGVWEADVHIGLVVYNVEEPIFDPITCTLKGPYIGINVWDGDQWQCIGPKNISTDTREVTDDPTNRRITLTVKDTDGTTIETTTYHYASFGVAGTWMTENLATMYMQDGSKIPDVYEGSTDPRLVAPNYLLSGDPLINTTNKLGYQYNWIAAMNGQNCLDLGQRQEGYLDDNPPTPGPDEVETLRGTIQGICPKGWHLPSDREWNQLEKEINNNMALYTDPQITQSEQWNNVWETEVYMLRGSTANGQGKAMKSKTPVPGEPDPTNGASAASDALGNRGFNALLVGYDVFNGYGNESTFWTASGNDFFAWSRTMYSDEAQVRLSASYQVQYLSMRCKKDN